MAATAAYNVATANCPDTKKALGGGVTSNAGYHMRVYQSGPFGQATGWTAMAYTDSDGKISAFVWVICASVSP